MCHLADRYQKTRPLTEKMESTEIRPNDYYIVMASHILWDLWLGTRLDKYFYLATALLHKCLETSPADFHAKLMLIR